MKPHLAAALISLVCAMPAHADTPVVLELFTSQGCSSCPPADALLQTLAADPHLLALSFHITYWDDLGWRDPFSLPASTARQRNYAQTLQQSNVYTPELVIDGRSGVIGSRRSEVLDAIKAAQAQPKPIAVVLKPGDDGQTLSITFSGAKPAGVATADIWLITFNPQAVTAVRHGENSGRDLTSINNVTSITQIGQIGDQPLPTLQAKLTGAQTDGYAIVVQAAGTGAVIGAGSYLPVKS